MSADIYLEMDVDTGGPEPYHIDIWNGNITYNLSPMWYDAGWEFHGIEGQQAGELLDRAARTLETLKAKSDKYRAMNPANGWGDYDGCVAFFEEMVEVFRKHPKATIRTWL